MQYLSYYTEQKVPYLKEEMSEFEELEPYLGQVWIPVMTVSE